MCISPMSLALFQLSFKWSLLLDQYISLYSYLIHLFFHNPKYDIIHNTISTCCLQNIKILCVCLYLDFFSMCCIIIIFGFLQLFWSVYIYIAFYFGHLSWALVFWFCTILFIQNIVDLQCCVNFKWFNYNKVIQLYALFSQNLLPYMLLQNIDYSSLCYMTSPC